MRRRTGKTFELETLEERILLSGDPLLDPLAALESDHDRDELLSAPGISASENDVLLEAETTTEDRVTYNPASDLLTGLTGTDDGDREGGDLDSSELSAVAHADEERFTAAAEPTSITGYLPAGPGTDSDGHDTQDVTPEIDADRVNKAVYDFDGYAAPPLQTLEDESSESESTSFSTSTNSSESQGNSVLLLTEDLHLSEETSLEGTDTLIVSDGTTLSGVATLDLHVVNEGLVSPAASTRC